MHHYHNHYDNDYDYHISQINIFKYTTGNYILEYKK